MDFLKSLFQQKIPEKPVERTPASIPPGSILRHRLQVQGSEVVIGAWSPDGRILICASEDGIIRLWDTQTGQLLRSLTGHAKWVQRVAWSPDGRFLVSTSGDGTIRLWNAQIGQLEYTLTDNRGIIETFRREVDHYTSESLEFKVAVSHLVWSPDGNLLALGSHYSIHLWDVQNRQRLLPDVSSTEKTDVAMRDAGLISEEIFVANAWRRDAQVLPTLDGSAVSMAWSPDGHLLAFERYDSVYLWDVQTRQERVLSKDVVSRDASRMAWSPDGRLLAANVRNRDASDETIHVWDVQTNQQLLQVLMRHSGEKGQVTWSPDGNALIFARWGDEEVSGDYSIHIWNPFTGQLTHKLEGHTKGIWNSSFFSNGHLFASQDRNKTTHIWRANTWELVATLKAPAKGEILFHPNAPILAISDESDGTIDLWELDTHTLLNTDSAVSSIHYANAKVVLVGESGVGKSGLSLVLIGKPFAATESTHGRHIWVFERQEVEREGTTKEIRETLLWDLAGQPDYRLIHQFYLNQVTVALIVFDAHSPTDPFAGVRHWDRALRSARQSSGYTTLPLKKFLVAARTDRGGRPVSRERIDLFVRELGFAGYFETSAKEGRNIAELVQAIRATIDWDTLPHVISTDIFSRIKAFLLMEKQEGRLLATIDALYQGFLSTEKMSSLPADLQAQFTTCLGLLEASGLIRQLSFGQFVLLQPELLDAYASALVIAVKDEPDGFGNIAEERVRKGDFPIPPEDRLRNKADEQVLLLAMIEELVRHEIVLRERGELIFPSQSTREYPGLSQQEHQTTSFMFEGPVFSIYTTLVVRLSHSGLFQRQELWKNAATYTTKMGGIYGIHLHLHSEERGELTLFFDTAAGEETRFHFEAYIREHLQQYVLEGSIEQRYFLVCPECATALDPSQVMNRQKRGYTWITCGVCDTKITLPDKEGQLARARSSHITEMNYSADQQREYSAAATIVDGKLATEDFDVFLCYNGVDKSQVKAIGQKLKERGLLPWLDEWELRPGLPWQRLLEQQIKQIKAAAVFVGKDGIGPWQQEELEALLRQFQKRGCPVIPVLLSDFSIDGEPQLPLFLAGRTWVDFRAQNPDPMDRLVWGVTGKRYPNNRERA